MMRFKFVHSVLKREVQPIESPSAGELTELEEQIRIQNEQYFEVFDFIANHVPKDEQIRILNANGQAVPDTDTQVSSLHDFTN